MITTRQDRTGGIWAEGQAENRRKIGKNRKHVSGKTANASIYNKDGVPFRRKIGRNRRIP